MFEQFDFRFAKDSIISANADINFALAIDYPALKDFFLRYAGTSFGNGLYRVVSHFHMAASDEFIAGAFPEFVGRATCFSYDWLGRLFALDFHRQEGGDFGVLMFEPGAGKVLEIPANLISFHENELINYANEALATDFYEQWLMNGGEKPNTDQCIGYKKPLFLGGGDTIKNLELANLEVYWAVSAQLISKTRYLPAGTKINNIIVK
jgi:hypothetical protein